MREGGSYVKDPKTGKLNRVAGTEAPADGLPGPRDAKGRPLGAAPTPKAPPAGEPGKAPKE